MDIHVCIRKRLVSLYSGGNAAVSDVPKINKDVRLLAPKKKLGWIGKALLLGGTGTCKRWPCRGYNDRTAAA